MRNTIVPLVVLVLLLSGSVHASTVTGSVTEAAAISDHKLGMSIAWLKEKILKEDSSLSEQQCIGKIHSMLSRLGFSVSEERVEHIVLSEQKVSNSVSDIEVIEVAAPRRSSGFRESFQQEKSPLKVSEKGVAKASAQVATASAHVTTPAPMKKSTTPLSAVQVLSGRYNRFASACENQDSPLEAFVGRLKESSSWELRLYGQGVAVSANELVLKTLVSMGLPSVELSGDWKNSSASGFAAALRKGISAEKMKEFESKISVF